MLLLPAEKGQCQQISKTNSEKHSLPQYIDIMHAVCQNLFLTIESNTFLLLVKCQKYNKICFWVRALIIQIVGRVEEVVSVSYVHSVSKKTYIYLSDNLQAFSVAT
jgi:hypothetical protein